MDYLLTQFASTEAEAGKSDLFSSIGIDWKLLVLQTIAFLLLLAILKKWVYPPIVKMLDKREEAVTEAAKAASVAEKRAAEAQAETKKLLKQARAEASAIVSTAKQEAEEISLSSDKKAKLRAERIVNDAQDEIKRDIATAKKQLRNEMVDLVAAATEKVTSKVVDASKDRDIIAKNVKDIQ